MMRPVGSGREVTSRAATPPGPRTWAQLGWFGLTTVLARRTDPIVGSLIVTDRCNLACAHCAVANLRRVNYPFPRLQADLRSMYAQGVRILFLYGGEPFLWRDGDRHLADVVAEARRIGFLLVNAVTDAMARGLTGPAAGMLEALALAGALVGWIGYWIVAGAALVVVGATATAFTFGAGSIQTVPMIMNGASLICKGAASTLNGAVKMNITVKEGGCFINKKYVAPMGSYFKVNFMN